MANRYSTRTRLTGKLNGQLRKFLDDAFDGIADLQAFVKEKFGRDV